MRRRLAGAGAGGPSSESSVCQGQGGYGAWVVGAKSRGLGHLRVWLRVALF